MQTILITGGTGMIGKVLSSALLEKGYRVIILTRNKNVAGTIPRNLSYAAWDIEKQQIDEEAVQHADHIIHLAGANVGERRWTKKRKKEIVESRVKSGELLVKALRDIPNKVQSVISASAIGWYGPDTLPGKAFSENDPASPDFLGHTCELWEQSIKPVQQMGKRLVIFRTGIVLSRKEGMLPELIKPLKFGMAAIIGSGKQVLSWIHIDDLVRLYIASIENTNLNGIYNAVAPHPVPNKKLILLLAKMRNKFYLPVPVPSFVLKLALGEMSIEVLKSATVSAEKIQQAGFVFQYPAIENATGLFKS